MSDEQHPVVDGSIVIGAGVVFKGEVSVPGLASVNGTFEGTLKAKDLIVGESGRVSGAISAETADVRGSVSEHLTVRSKLTLRASGSISGGMSYSKITVEEGGVLTGTIEKIESASEMNSGEGMANSEQQQSDYRRDDAPLMRVVPAGE